jgi:hypothetical protein
MQHHQAQFQWQEGIRIALEGTKLLVLVCGGAIVALLTFVGNTQAKSLWFLCAMISYALGVTAGFWVLRSSYMAQLNYGNRDSHADSNSEPYKFHHAKAHRYNAHALNSAVVGIVLFVLGTVCAVFGFAPS